MSLDDVQENHIVAKETYKFSKLHPENHSGFVQWSRLDLSVLRPLAERRSME